MFLVIHTCLLLISAHNNTKLICSMAAPKKSQIALLNKCQKT